MPVVIENTPQVQDEVSGGDLTIFDDTVTDGLILIQSMGSISNGDAKTVSSFSVNGISAPFTSSVTVVGGVSPWFGSFFGYWLDADTPRPTTGVVDNDIASIDYSNEGVGSLELSDVDQTNPVGHGLTPDLLLLRTTTVFDTHTVNANNGDLVGLWCSCSNAGTISKPADIGSDEWVERWSTNSEVYIGGSLQKGAFFTLELTQDLSSESITAGLSGGTIDNCISQCIVVQSESGGVGGGFVPQPRNMDGGMNQINGGMQ